MVKTNYYTDKSKIEENALKALSLFEQQENINSIAVFPDIHYCSEKAIPVGVAFETTDVFYPLITGKDMGCGVGFIKFSKENLIKPFNKEKHYKALDREVPLMTDEGLGGGNHFLSIEESDSDIYIICHTGSRNLGIQMFQENYALLQEHNPGQEWLPIEFANDEYKRKYKEILDYARKRRIQFLTKTAFFLVKNDYISSEDAKRFTAYDTCHNLLEFLDGKVIHRKGSTKLDGDPAVIPLSMSRGSLIVTTNQYTIDKDATLMSCSHGAGRKLSRTDTLIYWHQLKKAQKEEYKKQFPEYVNKWGEIDSSILQEFDFAYKDSKEILSSQPYLIKVAETKPIATFKFTGL